MEHSDGEVSDQGSSHPSCRCGSKTRIRTSLTKANFGRRFFSCTHYVNEEKRGCDFFKWLDPKICAYGERVVSMLMDWHEKLKSERALIETTIANEVSKCKLQFAEYKSKMEVEAANYAVKVERQKTKFRAMQMKYRFALAFSWGLLIVFLFYPSSNILGSRLMLP
ncbi:hypothetical protein SLA2020_283730 [Shorea laevis]